MLRDLVNDHQLSGEQRDRVRADAKEWLLADRLDDPEDTAWRDSVFEIADVSPEAVRAIVRRGDEREIRVAARLIGGHEPASGGWTSWGG